MKKSFLFFALFLVANATMAQLQTINSQLKLGNVQQAGVNDTLILVQGTDKIVRKINKSSLVPEQVTPSLQEVTNNGNVTSHPIHAKEFRVDSHADSLMVLNNRYFSIGDFGSDYNGNWNKYFSVFDPQDYPEGFEFYNSLQNTDAGFNFYGNSQLNNSTLNMYVWDYPNVGYSYNSDFTIRPNFMRGSTYGGAVSAKSTYMLTPEEFKLYHDSPSRISFIANNSLDVKIGDVEGVLGASTNKVLVENSNNRIRVISDNDVQIGTDGEIAKIRLRGGGVNSTTITGDYIYLNNGSGAFNGQLEVEGLTADRLYKYPDASGHLGVIGQTAPASATATGSVGEIRVTSTYIYVCIANNTWVRAPLATW